MKRVKSFLFLLLIFSAANADGQLWKQYADSAKVFLDSNNMNSATQYYLKSKNELLRDSSNTETLSEILKFLGFTYYKQGNFKSAEPILLEVIRIKEQLYGKKVEYVRSCNNIVEVYRNMGEYIKAEFFGLETIRVIEKELGKENIYYASSCNNLGAVYTETDKFDKAKVLFIEAVRVRKKLLGEENPDYLISCSNLAELYIKEGDFEKGELLTLEVYNIRARTLGLDNPEYIESCGNLSNLYGKLGQFKKAEMYGLEAIERSKIVFGENHYKVAIKCLNLANLYTDMSKYETAEHWYLFAHNIFKVTLGTDHPFYGISCNNLGEFYRETGQYNKAESLFLEAKDIFDRRLGKDHYNYATSCNNLGLVYDKMGQYDRALTFFISAKSIIEEKYGKSDLKLVDILGNLAFVYQRQKQFDKAEYFILEGLQIIRNSLGRDNLMYASFTNNLGQFYASKGDYKQSASYIEEAKSILEKVLGKENLKYVEFSTNLGAKYWIIGSFDTAFKNYHEAIMSIKALVFNLYNYASETEKIYFLETLNSNLADFVSFAYKTEFHESYSSLYNLMLLRKNFVLNSSVQLQKAIYDSNDSVLTNIFNEWIIIKEQLSYWLTKPVLERANHQILLQDKANSLEKELVANFRFKQFKSFSESRSISEDNVRKALQQNAKDAIIEFIEFPFFNGKNWTDSTYYIALVLRKDKPEPELIKLFEEKELNELLKIYKGTSGEQTQLNYLYKTNSTQKKNLYDLIWKPLEEKLQGIKTVYFAPSGSLFKISFAALPVNDKDVLSDRYKLVQLNTTASVVNQVATNISVSDNFKLFGGVLYDVDSTAMKLAAMQSSANDVVNRSLPFDLSRDGVPEFKYLPGTGKEINGIYKLAELNKYPVTIYEGKNATEESFKSINGKNSPSILHIATHGFFFPDPKNIKKDDRIGGYEVFRQSDNPMIRSGLALAGANNAWKGNPVSGVEDGILTSYEVSNMYLPNTKLAVLSACETGLGDIQGSEGVYGLQRAFKIAGVENLVMSLWKVPDQETAEFMQQFYKNLFAKQTIQDAFYNAQTIMKNKYRNDPYKWAAWVLIR